MACLCVTLLKALRQPKIAKNTNQKIEHATFFIMIARYDAYDRPLKIF